MSSSSSSATAVLRRLVELTALFEKWQSRNGNHHHFGHALSLSNRQMGLADLSADTTQIISCKYKVRHHSCVLNGQLSTSTVMAMFDEFSTMHVAAYSPASMRGGVSVHLEANVCNKAPPPQAGDELILQSEILRMGRTMAFIRGETRNPKTDTVLHTLSHIKYLPAEGMLDFLLTGWRASPFKAALGWFLKDPTIDPDGKPIRDVLIPSIEYTGIGKATFCVEPEHCNPGGILHGGCQTVLMELVGKTLAKDKLKSEDVELKSIGVNFQSAGKKQLDIVASVVSNEDNLLRTKVEVFRHGTDKMLSEGNLLWSRQE